MPESGIISRMTWSKRGISVYDETGSFLFRLEGWMIGVMNQTIMTGLARIEKERIRRETYHAVQVAGADESGILWSAGQGNAGQGAHVGSGDAEHQEAAGARETAAEDDETLGVPV